MQQGGDADGEQQARATAPYQLHLLIKFWFVENPVLILCKADELQNNMGKKGLWVLQNLLPVFNIAF